MKQHIVSNCYLKAWCDPSCPSGYEPYLWLIGEDGATKTRRAPHKSLTQTDAFTITLPDGGKDLRVESTLARLEGNFVNVRAKVTRREELSEEDRLYLLAFMATMHTRTDPFANAMHATWSHAGKIVKDFEDAVASGRPLPPPGNISSTVEKGTPISSRDIDDILKNGRAYGVGLAIKEIVPKLWPMNITFLVAQKDSFFLTSDNPCVFHNPNAHQMHPMRRGAGLGMKEIEVTMPISPEICALLRHRSEFRGDGEPDHEGYWAAGNVMMDAMNRRAIGYAGRQFISMTSETNPSWFEPQALPPDAWENRFHPDGSPRTNPRGLWRQVLSLGRTLLRPFRR